MEYNVFIYFNFVTLANLDAGKNLPSRKQKVLHK